MILRLGSMAPSLFYNSSGALFGILTGGYSETASVFLIVFRIKNGTICTCVSSLFLSEPVQSGLLEPDTLRKVRVKQKSEVRRQAAEQ